jgi:hypothetical protein
MSEVLLHPPAPAPEAAPTDGSDAGPTPPGSRRSPRRRLILASAAVVMVVALAAGLLAVRPPQVTQSGGAVFADGAVSLAVEEFDERGVYSLRYVHGEQTEIRVPVRNDGPLPTTVTGIRLDGRTRPMIVPVGAVGVPVRLAPGEEATVGVQVRFDNCEFYTERAMDVYGGLTVDQRTLGVAGTGSVRLDHQLVVRSPMMVTCPDRVSDRGAFLRGG